MKFQTEHFRLFLDSPEDRERKIQPLRRKTGKRTEVFWSGKIEEVQLEYRILL